MKQHIKKIHEHVFFKRFHIGHFFIAILFQIVTIVFIFSMYSSTVRSDQTFTVNSTTDNIDDDPGDGVCHTDEGECTLRAAIQESNILSGADTISVPAGTYTLNASIGGDLDILDNVILNGAGPSETIIDGNGDSTGDRVFDITSNSKSITFTGMTIENGVASNGGGIYIGPTINSVDLTLQDVVIQNNTATSGHGGGLGIFDDFSATDVILNSVVFSNNTASGNGGAIYAQAEITASDVTIEYNEADLGGGIFGYLFGSFTNSTIAHNTAATNGGGIYFFQPIFAGLSLTNVTIANNTAPDNGGGGIYANAYEDLLSLKNVLFASNAGDNCLDVSEEPNQVVSEGNNISDDSSCSVILSESSDQNNIDALIGTLSANGGLGKTIPLLIDSPAIDSGTNNGCPDTDQRGLTRPYNLVCDIGAYEYSVDPTNTPTPTFTPTPTPGPSATPTPGAPKCEPPPPSLPPDLYEVTVSSTEAILQLTPAGKPYTGYVVTYGFSSGDERFGAETTQSEVTGSIRYKIMQLDSNRVYYFRVRGQNICQPGPWSDWLAARTTTDSSTFVFTKYNQSEISIQHGNANGTIPNPTATPTIINNPITSTPTPTVQIIVPEPTTKILTVTPIKTTSPTPTPYLIPDPPRPKVSENIIEQTRRFITKSIFNPLINFFQSFFR